MTALRNTWLIAGTSVFQPYPCRCEGGRRGCSPLWCPCAGRLDPWHCPAWCCSWVHNPAVAAGAQKAYAASRGR